MSRSSLSSPSRRDLLKSGAAATTALSLGGLAHAAGSDVLRVGLIGCGGRGTGAAADCVAAAPGVEVHAMGDLFADRLASSRDTLAQAIGAALKVTDETCFSGWDAFRRVLASGVDLVILATPPHFRPEHLEAAVAAGKHVFMEKPVAVDPVGVRRVIAAGRSAQEHGLAIVAGTQRRHQEGYLEALARVHDGAIGELVAAQCYWNQGGLWMLPRKESWSDMEWQLRNWLYFTWLSGDHVCEQHIHNLDVLNWAFGGPPVRATAMGGRQARTDPAYGQVYDHFAIELEYPGGVRAHNFFPQIDNCANQVGERLVGTLGTCDPSGRIEGPNAWRHRNPEAPSPYRQEHADLVASIRAGEPLNEARRVAESTLTAIMGRMSAYTGKSISWEEALASKLDLRPERYELGHLAVAPVAIPGVTEFV